MNPYQQKKRWKYLLLVFAVIIASGSLLYTNYLVKHIAKSERTRAEVWAMSMKQVLGSDDNDFLNYVFAVRDSSIVPAIVTDAPKTPSPSALSVILPLTVPVSAP